MLDKAGMKAGTLYFVNGLMMMFSFFVLRVLMYPCIAVRCSQMSQGLEMMPMLGMLVVVPCYFTGMFLQFFWFWEIFQGALKVIKSRDTPRHENAAESSPLTASGGGGSVEEG